MAQHPDNSNSWVWTLPDSGLQRFFPHSAMQSGAMRLLFEPRSGSRIWAGKKRMSKSKKRTPILLDRNSPTAAAGRFRLTWSGKDSEWQRKTGSKTYKKEWRAKVGAFVMTSLTLVVWWQNPTPWKSHFSPMQRWLFCLFPTCTPLPFVSRMASTPTTCQKQNSACSQLIVISALRFVGLHDIYSHNIHPCFLHPCAHQRPSRLGHWECWSYVELNYPITSCLMRDSALGTQTKWPHVLVAGFCGVSWWTVEINIHN